MMQLSLPYHEYARVLQHVNIPFELAEYLVFKAFISLTMKSQVREDFHKASLIRSIKPYGASYLNFMVDVNLLI